MSGDLVGTTVGGKYQVRSKIGAGSMGDVYEAMNGTQAVALKVLKVDDHKLAARFVREAKTMSLFQHPNIVELLEVGKLGDGRLFFAAELVRGVTLRQLIEEGPVEPRRALSIVRQVLGALGHAHGMGVVHRDIKPENVMLADGGSPDGQSDLVKILDFGVAKLIGDTPAVLGEGTLTITGYGALGTPYYISPEAVLGRPLDARADIYSIGAMLFEMLTGTPPYTHDDVAVLMRMHAAAPIPKLGGAATPELELVASEALAKKPEMRFKSAAEMIDAIDLALRSLENPFFEEEPAARPQGARPPKKATDVFGALPMKAPAPAPSPPSPRSPPIASPPEDPSASKPAAFSPASIPSASQPVQSEPFQHQGPAKPRANLPGVAPYHTPVAGVPSIQNAPRATTDPAAGPGYAATANMPHPTQPPPGVPVMGAGGPVMGVVVPASGQAPMFAPPMPVMQPPPKPPNQLFLLAQKHKKYVLAGAGAFVLLIIIIIVATRGGGKPDTTAKSTTPAAKRAELVKAAQDQIAAGYPGRAVELIEREDDFGNDDEVWLVLGHARISSNRRLEGLAAYERAIALDKKHTADDAIRANLGRILEGRDVAAGIVALDLALRLDPPAHDVVKQAAVGKQADIRKRAFELAEREKLADEIDRVDSWSQDLAQATNCDERLAAIVKLRRIADPRAIPALKRAKVHKCVASEVAEAIAHLESQRAPPP